MDCMGFNQGGTGNVGNVGKYTRKARYPEWPHGSRLPDPTSPCKVWSTWTSWGYTTWMRFPTSSNFESNICKCASLPRFLYSHSLSLEMSVWTPPKESLLLKKCIWGCFDTYLNQQNLPIIYIAKKEREAPSISTGWFQNSIVFLIFLCILSETLNDLETNILSATQVVRTSFNHLFPPVFFCWSHEFKTLQHPKHQWQSS